MCGIPHHAVRAYLVKLTELGHRVALCEQLEDPRAVRGIVKRDVVRVVTPGVILDEESLDPARAQLRRRGGGRRARRLRLAFLDVTTGDFRATEAATGDALVEEIGRVAPRELVFGRDDDGRRWRAGAARALPAACRAAPLATATTPAALARRCGAAGRRRWRSGRRAPRAAAAAVLRYAARHPARGRAAGRAPRRLPPRPTTLVIDEQARRHLELTESLLDRRRVGLADRGARREPDRDGRAPAAPLAAVSARSTSRPSAAATTPSNGWSPRTPRATPPAACSPRSPTSSAWSGAPASASRRRAISPCSAVRSRGCRAARGARGRATPASSAARSPRARACSRLGDDLARRIAAELAARRCAPTRPP